METSSKFDVIVIGGGPAGLMAAGQASHRGMHTLLLEKMDMPGRKLRITGMKRCNLTNIASQDEFMGHYGPNGKFLRQAFGKFFNEDLVVFIEGLGIQTAVERGGRVFPTDGDATAVTEKLIKWVKNNGAEIRAGMPVERILAEDGIIQGIQLRSGDEIRSRNVILATGGASYTGTGSTGDGYKMAAKLGHTIIPLRPALVPIKTAGEIAMKLQGLPLRNARVTLLINGKKRDTAFGEMLFTYFGLSGPIILTMSGRIVDALDSGKTVSVSIDLKPALDEDKLNVRLLRELDAHGKQYFGTMLKQLLPMKMIPVCAELNGIPLEKPCHQITSAERIHLVRWLKDFKLEVTGYLRMEAGMVTAGGVSLKEINPRTMESVLVKGLYFAGEVIDLAADTGGYNLQAAFSTGWLAGNSAGTLNKHRPD
jgi:predicted Rossmann fold flavoprotein